MNSQVHQATSSGYRVEIHAIGDEAADVALTALETVNVAREKRPILIHCQVSKMASYLFTFAYWKILPYQYPSRTLRLYV
jgi:predicted amidohydrolase YtcJ